LNCFTEAAVEPLWSAIDATMALFAKGFQQANRMPSVMIT
jgi:hypothetical protein